MSGVKGGGKKPRSGRTQKGGKGGIGKRDAGVSGVKESKRDAVHRLCLLKKGKERKWGGKREGEEGYSKEGANRFYTIHFIGEGVRLPKNESRILLWPRVVGGKKGRTNI